MYWISIVLRQSTYLQYSSVHPWAICDFLYCSSCSHLSVLISVPFLIAALVASFAFQWSLCHWDSPHFFASGTVNTGKVVWHNQGLSSCFNLSDCIFVWSEACSACTEVESFRQRLVARMALYGSGFLSQLVQLEVAQIMDGASGFLAEDHRVFWFLRSSRIDFVCEPALNVSTDSCMWPIRSSSFNVTLCAIDQFLQFWGLLEIQAFLQHEWCLAHHSATVFPAARGFWLLCWVAWIFSSLPSPKLPQNVSSCEVLHSQKCLAATPVAAAAAFAKNFLSTTFGGGRAVASL